MADPHGASAAAGAAASSAAGAAGGGDAGQLPPDPLRVVDLRLISGKVVCDPLRINDTVHKARTKAAEALLLDVQQVTLACPIRGPLTQDDALLGGPTLLPGTRVTLQVMFEAKVEMRMMSGQVVGEPLRITDTVRTARVKAAEFLHMELPRVSLVCPVRGPLTQDSDRLAGPDYFPGQPVITLNVLCEALADGGVRGDPRRGLSVGYLLGKLTADLNIGAHETVYDIRDRICAKGEGVMCPRDGRKGAAYVDVADDKDAGTATIMLSYTWGYLVADILSALRLYCHDNVLDLATTRVWMCCLCNNQHRGRESPSNLSAQEFTRRFHPLFARGSGDAWNIKVVGLLSPWRRPLYVRRIWCLFEAWKASKTNGVELDFMLPEHEAQDFHASLVVDRGLDPVLRGLSNIKVQQAEAFVAAEGDRIRELIAEDGNYSTFEAVVKERLQKWFVEAARRAPQARAGPDFQPTACRNIADLMMQFGDKDCAQFLESSIWICQQHGGGAQTKNIDLAELYLRLGRNLGTGGDQAGALEKCKKALEFCQEDRAAGSEMTTVEAEVLRTIASISRKNGELRAAFQEYSEALAVYEVLKGSDQWMALDSGWILLNLGIVWGLLKESGDEVPADERLTKFGYVNWTDYQYYEKAWQIYEHHHKEDSPMAAWLLRNRGVSYLRDGKLAEARAEFSRAQQIYEALGTKNVENYGELRKSQGMLHLEEENYQEAANCFEDARKVFLQVMGMKHGLINSLRSLQSFYVQREDKVSADEVFQKEMALQLKLFSQEKVQRIHRMRSQLSSEFGSPGGGARRATSQNFFTKKTPDLEAAGGEEAGGPQRAVSEPAPTSLAVAVEEVELEVPVVDETPAGEEPADDTRAGASDGDQSESEAEAHADLGEVFEGSLDDPIGPRVHFEAYTDGTTTVSTRNGKVRITVPEGAVAEAKLQQFDIRRLSSEEVEALVNSAPTGDRCSDVYKMSPSGSFEEPVLLRMQVDRSHGSLAGCGCTGGIRILRLQEGASEWKVVRHCWADEEGYICAWIPGFSYCTLACCFPTLRVAMLVDGGRLRVSVALAVDDELLPALPAGWEEVETESGISQFTDAATYEMKLTAFDPKIVGCSQDKDRNLEWSHTRKMKELRYHFDAPRFASSEVVMLRIRQGEKDLVTWDLWRPPRLSATATADVSAVLSGPAPPTPPPSPPPEANPLLPVAALCVGNNNYQGNPLQVAVSDATQVYEKILDMGFLREEAILETNVSLDTFRRCCHNFVEDVKAKIKDWSTTTPRPLWLAFVFYAGHGTLPPKGEGVLMWPVDVPVGKDTEKAVNLHRALLHDLVRIEVPRQARLVCVLCFDCCREQIAAKSVESYISASRATQGEPGDADQGDGKAIPTFCRAEFLIAWACGHERKAIEKPNGGVFTRSLLQNLDVREEDFQDTLKAVRLQVIRDSMQRQRPCVTDDTQPFRFTKKELQAGRERLALAKAKAKAKAEAAPPPLVQP